MPACAVHVTYMRTHVVVWIEPSRKPISTFLQHLCMCHAGSVQRTSCVPHVVEVSSFIQQNLSNPTISGN